jgi:hypothetical protein
MGGRWTVLVPQFRSGNGRDKSEMIAERGKTDRKGGDAGGEEKRQR